MYSLLANFTVITSTKEVMLLFCLFVFCLLTGLRKNYSTHFHNIRWKGGTEEHIRF